MFTIIIIPRFMSSGSRWEGGGGETAQGEHQEAECCGGAAGEGTEQAAVGLG